MKARVTVTLKSGVLDPQGKAIEGALKSLGIAGVASVRQGKVFDIELEGNDKRKGRGRAQGCRGPAARQHRDRELSGSRSWVERLRHAVAVCAALAMSGAPVAAAGADEQPKIDVSKFAEVPWPFLLDQWGLGQAFKCAAAGLRCGGRRVSARENGYCNCATGVSDDEELDRVGDVSLLSSSFVPLRAGEPVTVGWMKGRSRVYDVAPRYSNKQNALSVAINDKCDVIVATVLAQRTVPPGSERAAMAFLNSDTVLRFVKSALGL